MERTVEVKVICSWCQKELGTKQFPFRSIRDTEPTHGICDECYKNVTSVIESTPFNHADIKLYGQRLENEK